MAENTTSITVKVDIDLGGFKDKIQEAVHEALTTALQLLAIQPADITVSPIVEAETLAVGDRVKVIGNLRYADSPADMDTLNWWFARGDTGRIDHIREGGDAMVIFDKNQEFPGIIALTSLGRITAEPAARIDSLADADRTRKYTDRVGDTWRYGHSDGSTGWYWTDSDEITGYGRESDEADYWGPFELVAE